MQTVMIRVDVCVMKMLKETNVTNVRLDMGFFLLVTNVSMDIMDIPIVLVNVYLNHYYSSIKTRNIFPLPYSKIFVHLVGHSFSI